MIGAKFEELVSIMYKLRKECPWDREQTHDSIKSATLEESYEVVEAIDDKNYDELKNELGDLLLHIVFHSVIAEETGHFKIEEVIQTIKEKLIRRHPHIFNNLKVSGSDEITRNWETIKLEEGRESVLEGVPRNLPELHKAFRLQEKASKVGFDWENKDDVWNKLLEELNELKEEAVKESSQNLEEELGDLLFCIVNYSRFLRINPENALRRTNEKFVKRFQYIESKLKESGKSIVNSNLAEMDKLWDESKQIS